VTILFQRLVVKNREGKGESNPKKGSVRNHQSEKGATMIKKPLTLAESPGKNLPHTTVRDRLTKEGGGRMGLQENSRKAESRRLNNTTGVKKERWGTAEMK